MASYVTRLKSDIEHWRSTGLIEASTADAMLRDADVRHGKGFGLGSVIGMLAALLLGAAVLQFVAANWEDIPRIARVVMLFVLIAASYLGGAVAANRGATGWAEALWLVGAAAFGGSIALIGQMYHLSGDEAQAIAVWAIGTGLAAALLRSPALTVATTILAGVWLVTDAGGYWNGPRPSMLILPAAVILWALSFWTRSASSRALVLAVLILYGALLFADGGAIVVPIGIAVVSAAVFILACLLPREADRFADMGSVLPAMALLGFLFGMALLQVDLEQVGAQVLSALVTFAGIVGALLMGGRDSRRIRRLAYTGFAVELCYVYVQVLGSMLGTATFFLASGVALALLAWGIRRVERRFATGGASA